MKIMICSAGRRVKLIEYFKKELHDIGGKVVVVDCDQTASALYHGDYYEVVPRIDHPDYINQLKKLCADYEINAILSLIDPELSILARHKQEFANLGVQIIVSDPGIVDLCYDKLLTYQFLEEHGIPAVPTYNDMDKVLQELISCKINFPLIVKPKNGSSSIGIHKISTEKELKYYLEGSREYIVQPFIYGDEFGVDCYIDLITKEPTHIFIKKKLAMRAGETDKSISVKDPALKKLINQLLNNFSFIGPIDIDCFKTENGYLISEINPRFGGGYLHAHEMGQNFVKSMINNLNGKADKPNHHDYEEGKTMVKFDHYLVF